MNLPESLYSIQVERTVCGGLINFPNTLLETSNILDDSCFYTREHRTIFSVLRGMILNGDKIEKIILAQKIKDLGIKFEIDIFEYIESICFSQINPVGIIECSKELVKLKVKRELYENAAQVQKYIKESNDDVNKVISTVDNIYNKKVNSFLTDDEPADLFSEAEAIINERAANPIDNIGIETPFKIYNEMFGGFRVGITAICGRAKNNKSTILLNMGFGSILNNPKLSVLFLDTELKKHDQIFRSIGALSQINPNFLEDGTWVKNREFVDKLKNSWQRANLLKGKFHHHYIGNRGIDEIITIIKRWYYNKCGRGNQGLVIFDYIKIGDEKLSNYNAEHQALGQKINALNALSQELTLPILSSMQLNRSAITDNKEDESAISMTDRLSWFANGVFIFRKKRPDEIGEEGASFGTHKLIPVVLRYQGKNTGLLDLVKIDDGHHGKVKYKQNFINYNFSNFMLEECGTLRDIVIQQKLQANFQKDNNNNNQGANDI